MTNHEDVIGNIIVDSEIIEKVEHYKHLEPKIVIEKSNTQELMREQGYRIQPITTYGAETKVLPKSIIKKNKSKSNREENRYLKILTIEYRV